MSCRARIACLTVGLALAGCNAETALVPETPPATALPVLDPGGAATVRASAEFRQIDLNAAEDASLRAQLGLPALCAGVVAAGCTSASTLAVQNVHVAHAAKLSDGQFVRGGGQLIALVDDGFLKTHQEFAGKTLLEYVGAVGSLGVASHGTAVAGVAAARADGVGILGVAPDASLHLTSWGNVPAGGMLAHLRGATLDAAARGAVVQNNSWGWTAERSASAERAAFLASGLQNYADYAPNSYGGSPAAWSALFSAYKTFQSGGVIVYANSNNENLPDASAWAALPLLVPELAGAWIVAGNALLEVDGSGRIAEARLLSAPCGSAAAFCVVSDGSVRAPTSASPGAYSIMTGSSFAAPQVAGQVALLSQAFPNLTPAEITTRLLATAQNGWTGFQNSVSGQVTLAPGVVRPHSRLYGMGVPDMAAALAPVGGLSIASGQTVASAQAMPVGNGVDASAPVVGAAIADALGGRSIMLLDALGTDFHRTGAEIGMKGSTADAPVANVSREIAAQAQSFAFGFRAQAPGSPVADLAGARLFFSQSLAGATGSRFSSVLRLDSTRLLHMAGYMSDAPGAPAMGMSVSRLTERGRFASELTMSAGHHRNRLFASYTSGPFLGVDSTTSVTASLGATARLGRGWTLSGVVELGAGATAQRPGSLVAFGPLVHASAGVAANRHDLFFAGDRLTLYAGIRPRTVAGMATVRLPTSRDTEGRIAYDSIAVDLAAGGGLPARAGFGYAASFDHGLDLSMNVNLDFDALRHDQAAAASASVALRRRF